MVIKYNLSILGFGLIIGILFPIPISGQNTFTLVYNLLQTNCNGSSCHDGVTPDIFSVVGSESAVYNSIVGQNPSNTFALAKKHKLVLRGDVTRSFLLRKMAYGISDPLNIDKPDEGDLMPISGKLDDEDIELVRQWILRGAPATGNVVDVGLIHDYYNGLGKDDTHPDHDPPDPSEGVQMYVGKVFIPPATEDELFIKYDPGFADGIEINRITTILPEATHHFVVYKYFPGGESHYAPGLRGLDDNPHADVADGIGSADGKWDFKLPSGTAYFWSKNSILDLNLHIRNTDTTYIIGCDLYVNIYTQPVGTAKDYMLVRNFPNFEIAIPEDGKEHTFSEEAFDTTETRMWNIWMLYTHTHRYGTDYDIWFRNVDGTKGEQIYEGFYNQEYTFNQGYYAWGVDVAFRYFENPFLQVDPRLGFIHQAKYINTAGPDTVYWGDTSLDEMMVIGFQFTYGDSLGKLPTSVAKVDETAYNFKVYPNPFNDVINTYYTIKENSHVKIELFNMVGERLAILEEETKDKGNYLSSINTGDLQLKSGFYFVNLSVNGTSAVRKLLNIN